MSEILDRIMKMNIGVQSPDRSVWGRMNLRTGMTVELEPEVRRRHTEETLGAQVEHVLGGLAAGQRQAAGLIREAARDGRDAAAPDSRIAKRRAAVDRELDEVDIEAESTDGYVRVRQLGQSRFIVVIRPGAIDRLDDRRLTGELNSAIRQVKRQ